MTEQKRTELPNWTDLQFVAELSRHGSLSATARALGVTHATVARRIGALDESFGRPLFKRQDGRYVPTPTGSHVVALAREMEEPALRVARAMAGVLPHIAGPVRITATEHVATELLTPMVAELQKTHAGLEIEVIASRENLSLARRDADIALRLGRPTQGDLFTRRLVELSYYRYASRRYLKARGVQPLQYIGYCGVSAETREVRALSQLCSDDMISMRTNNIAVRLAAVAQGLGVGLLPKYSAERHKGLVCLDTKPAMARELWLVVHRDLREVPRIKLCTEYIAKTILCRRNQIE